MFIELENVDLLFEQLSGEFNYAKNIGDVRFRFGLKPLAENHEDNREILESLFDDSASLEIKIEGDGHLAPIVTDNEIEDSNDDLSSDIGISGHFKVQNEESEYEIEDESGGGGSDSEEEEEELMLLSTDQKKRKTTGGGGGGGRAKRKADDEKLFE
jgi:hypothetical protein